jgi:hypothetical protein
MSWQIVVDHFIPSEFGPRPDIVSPILVMGMDRLRKLARCKIYILTAWASDGHSDGSFHYSGLAVDCRFDQGQLTFLGQLFLILNIPQFNGIGFYPHWGGGPGWHIDIRPKTPHEDKVFWYRSNGQYRYGFWNMLTQVKTADSQRSD